ncbi:MULTISPECIES: YqeG family HAD IIIA-type phosphatase [Bacillales]|uniref:YqeG family HAD IIIA-type phosphatase n=1 Tax=Bacillales TaxID=1385 RepID=UPI0018833183|nr:YqeG family HAD IIIA-type phosphatase [Pseudalkalibacillus hwajinpoensis]MBF0706472.1 YqeG family HAD IIIA-type phosphatase [Pseudalkalibacillus hwajinpoensis]WLR60615.1 YqeG family HAD IIIA-type phosphatase [Pseudalkalibacillus hwajinpoensis]
MLNKFLPNEHVQDIFQISPELLKERGIKGIITDLDNTLVEWNRADATPKLLKWFKQMSDEGILVTIVSNNNKTRVEKFASPVEVPFIYEARKPMTKAFRKALKDMNLSADDTVVIGDQIFTDVVGGNRMGLHTILVVPVASTDGFFTKFNRKIESIFLTWMKRKGKINWEE